MTDIIDTKLEQKLDALNALVILYTSSNLPTNRAHHEYQILLKYIEENNSSELLEALEEIVDCEINRRDDLKTRGMSKDLYRFSDDRVKKAQAAIAKARGLTCPT